MTPVFTYEELTIMKPYNITSKETIIKDLKTTLPYYDLFNPEEIEIYKSVNIIVAKLEDLSEDEFKMIDWSGTIEMEEAYSI